MFTRFRHPSASTHRLSQGPIHAFIHPLFHIILSITLFSGLLIQPQKHFNETDSEAQVYWGAMMKGSIYGYSDAPWSNRTINAFHTNASKKVSILHWGQPWFWNTRGGYQPFQTREVEKTRRLGSIPLINWNAWDLAADGSTDQPNFKLRTIINGNHDVYIRQWARDAKAWGYPLFVRMNHEMNGDWYPWSEQQNGNRAGEYVKAWRHVVDIFRQVSASNVTWVWCVNTIYPEGIPMRDLYPGDSYVDWVAFDGYNWGTHPAKDNVWESFNNVVKPTYDELQMLAPTKPIMIAEIASTEHGGSKAAWITDMLKTQLPTNFPNIKAVVWFNWNIFETSATMDWAIESSNSAEKAFASGIASSYYASNTFGNLPKLTKVAPLPLLGSPLGTSLLPPPPANMIENPSFETSRGSSWYAPWALRNDLGATFTKDSSTKTAGRASMKVKMAKSKSEKPWLVQLRYDGLAVSAGKSYTISFSAKASKARTIDVLLQKSGVKEYSKQKSKLATTWTRYTYTYIADKTTNDVTLSFNMAGTSGRVWLDDVVVTTR